MTWITCTIELLVCGMFVNGVVAQPPAKRFESGRVAGSNEQSTVNVTSGLQPSIQADRIDRHLIRTSSTQRTTGPDVIVSDLPAITSYGNTGGVSSFSVGTTSCNIGDEILIWIATTPEHPVIAQNAYRLRQGRFEQIGQSWVKHAFSSLNTNACNQGCIHPGSSSLLGVGCSDPYSSLLNGVQSILGPKSEINVRTGSFPYPPILNPDVPAITGRRVQIFDHDLDPNQQGGGAYFVEGHYVTADDAAAGNQDNNVSWRPVNVEFDVVNNRWRLQVSGTTHQQQPAIFAWQETDPSVVLTDVRVQGEGLFTVGVKATDLGDGGTAALSLHAGGTAGLNPLRGGGGGAASNSLWLYEYAIHNRTSDRSAGRFSIPIEPGATIPLENIGFHGMDYHSFEVFDGTPWDGAIVNGNITWSTTSYMDNPNANALRWGTLYNFRFVIDAPPQVTIATLGLFKPGSPTGVSFETIGPVFNSTDCNNNGVADSIDIVKSTSLDCNRNRIPDTCETFEPAVLQAERVGSGFTLPVYLTAPTDGSRRLFIVEQAGLIRILHPDGSVEPEPFLDIAADVSSGGEQGLLSMAFHPNYPVDPRFYVNYTDTSGATMIEQYVVSADNPNLADPDSGVVLKSVAQPFPNHNGGQLQFGPDGFLYVGMGDGGSGDDPGNHAQDLSSLLGKMLRLDVDRPPKYIPIDNPFVNLGVALEEIWSLGLRNPWRFSFDRLTGDLYLADVGQGLFEEIDFQPSSSSGGENYGWRCMEGFSCTGNTGCTCNDPALNLPIHVYDHGVGRCSVTGGYVYRGCAIAGLSGTYFFSDYCTGEIYSFRYENGVVVDFKDRSTELTATEGSMSAVVSFGEDADGELYVVSHLGDIFRIAPRSAAPTCGNGVVEQGEQCDDGNVFPGDGCDDLCRVELNNGSDDCTSAVPAIEGMRAFDTSLATTDGPAITSDCGPEAMVVAESDLWYCYRPSCTGRVTVSLCGTAFDTGLAVYEGCACPLEGTAIACGDDQCATASEVSLAVTACRDYLIRVGGVAGASGFGTLTITCTPDTEFDDCNRNGVNDVTDIACGVDTDDNANGLPDLCEQGGDRIRGGRLYDRWWSALGIEAPLPTMSDHPLWATRPDTLSNTRTAEATWRCKECHGWDYKGVDGQYATGDHRTGFTGVLDTALTDAELITLMTEPPGPGPGPLAAIGHDYGSFLTPGEILDLVAFLRLGVIDVDPFIDPLNGRFLGNPTQGGTLYSSSGNPSCITCHGSNGTTLNFGSFENPEYLGTVAEKNPWEFLHKVRFAQPGTAMPSWLLKGGTNQGAADIGRFAQDFFPVDCIVNQQCDDAVECTTDTCTPSGRCISTPDDSACPGDGLFCTGMEVCDSLLGCVSEGNPCRVIDACNELDAAGTAGLNPRGGCGCEAPLVLASGPRSLGITPKYLRPVGSLVPVRLRVTLNCDPDNPRYVGPPTGSENIALLVYDRVDAALLSPIEWGETVYVQGIDIVPLTDYMIEADCGNDTTAVWTQPVIATTPPWGDVAGFFVHGAWTPPDGKANILDIIALVDGFKQNMKARPLYVLDLLGCIPNQTIDIVDILAGLSGFKGRPYASPSSCPVPCDPGSAEVSRADSAKLPP